MTVTLPAGIESGKSLRLSGQGTPGRQGGPAGDLFIEIEVAPDANFKRDGKNILSDLKVPVATALLGGKIDVATLHGTVSLTVPAGTSSDQLLRVRGFGIKTKGGDGDHLVRVVITVPAKLDSEAAAAVREHLVTTTGG